MNNIILALFFFGSLLFGIGAFLGSKSAIHETLAIAALIMSTVSLGSLTISEELKKIRKLLEEQVKIKNKENLPTS